MDNVAELKKQLKDANDALEQFRIDTETLNAYRSANDNLHEIQETLEKTCSRMETEVSTIFCVKCNFYKFFVFRIVYFWEQNFSRRGIFSADSNSILTFDYKVINM